MAKYTNSISIAAPITPRNTQDNYPTHFDDFGNGGYRSVLTLSDRDNIQGHRKKNGMLVYIVEEDKTYILKSNIWEEVKIQITVKSVDNSVAFNDVETIKIDTNSGLGLNRYPNEPGTAVITALKPFTEFTDDVGNSISANNTNTVKYKESSTIKPKINGYSVEFNSTSYIYESSTPSIQHTIVHNLGTENIISNMFIIDNSSKEHALIPYKIIDPNVIEVNLTVARNILVTIIPLNI